MKICISNHAFVRLIERLNLPSDKIDLFVEQAIKEGEYLNYTDIKDFLDISDKKKAKRLKYIKFNEVILVSDIEKNLITIITVFIIREVLAGIYTAEF